MPNNFGFTPTDGAPYYFLSYNREDAEQVAMLARKLYASGIPIWYDLGLKYGSEWEKEISERLAGAKAVILVFTRGILLKESPYTKKEYEMALGRYRKKVFVVELDEIQSDEVPVHLVPWWYDIQKTHNFKASEYADLDRLADCVKEAILDFSNEILTPRPEPVRPAEPLPRKRADQRLPEPVAGKKERSNAVVSTIMAPIWSKREDETKLTTNYDLLCRQYGKTPNLITYDNSGKPDEQMLWKRHRRTKFSFPVTYELPLAGLTLEIRDSQRQYIKPDYVSAYYSELFGAHKTSFLYNNRNIRVDGWHRSGDKAVIKTSRTTYYDSMVTNRAMDYKLSDGNTIRNVFEIDTRITPLEQSVLSNHLGFNGFLESSDGYIPFVRRGANVSVGKRTLGPSVGASMKVNYALNDRDELTVEGLFEALRREFEDELCISSDDIEPFSKDNHHLIAAYRDLVEGGKPQLLVYVHSRLTRREIDKAFSDVSRIRAKEMRTDGTQLYWIARQELEQLCIAPDGIIHKGMPLKMVPSSAASVVMLIDHLKRNGGGGK